MNYLVIIAVVCTVVGTTALLIEFMRDILEDRRDWRK